MTVTETGFNTSKPRGFVTYRSSGFYLSWLTAHSISSADANPVGAGLPAITGKAGALHRSACIAGKPLKV
ncbi:hypothetical protein AAH995_21055 [Pseudomonas putida]|uniref:hypothetical protein n=1 Tax=Pseudomonas TaxID=286 RepID=UPI000AB67C0D|nr:hypothetical protein [Pseudomonas putida]